MRVFIAGIDGYLGWPLAQVLAGHGHQVGGCDGFHRRRWVEEMGSHSAAPIAPMSERRQAFARRFGQDLTFLEGDLTSYPFVRDCLRAFRPDAVVHLGEMPSAPYSMIDVEHCVFTQTNNLVGTLNLLHALRDEVPGAHLVKLGTMGEYGTPNVAIPEGFFEIEYRGRRDRLPFPRQAGSWYHQSKVHDSNNVDLACRIWGLAATDVMQGVVFGTRIDDSGGDERLLTRFDFDQCFGTAINRFCAMAIVGLPITPYGSGGQKRTFLPLRDSMRCLLLALENPARPGEYRVFNQFDEVHDLATLALKVQQAASERGLTVEVRHVENPRRESEEHFYAPDHDQLHRLGYRPSGGLDTEIKVMLDDLLGWRERILARVDALRPDIRWSGRREPVPFLPGEAAGGRHG